MRRPFEGVMTLAEDPQNGNFFWEEGGDARKLKVDWKL